ncbi:hypothetical protein BSKO_08193 [Bryopsis sp. KO-2023]|nr:hypothetical protein BSKO_08193 [Bryopsis sp. KO-2023]
MRPGEQRNHRSTSSPRRGDRTRKPPSRFSEFVVSPGATSAAPAPASDSDSYCRRPLGTRDNTSGTTPEGDDSWSSGSYQDYSEGDVSSSPGPQNARPRASLRGGESKSSRVELKTSEAVQEPKKEKLNAWLASALKRGPVDKAGSGVNTLGGALLLPSAMPKADSEAKSTRGGGGGGGTSRGGAKHLGGASAKANKTASSRSTREWMGGRDKPGAENMSVEYQKEFGRVIKRRKNSTVSEGPSPGLDDNHTDQAADQFGELAGVGETQDVRNDAAMEDVVQSSGSEGNILIENTRMDFESGSCLLGPVGGDGKEEAGVKVEQEEMEDGGPILEKGGVESDRNRHGPPVDQLVKGEAKEEFETAEAQRRRNDGDKNAARNSGVPPSLNGPSHEVQQLCSWLDDFKSAAAKVVSEPEGPSERGPGGDSMMHLFNQYPELAGAAAWTRYWQWKWTGKRHRDGNSRKRGRSGKEIFAPVGTAQFSTPPRGKYVEGSPGSTLHPWLQRVASDAACLSPSRRARLWKDAQKRLLNTALRTLPCQFNRLYECYQLENSDTGHLTSGVSYVVPSESNQEGVPSFARLPHTVIQPPNLKEIQSRVVSQSLETIKHQEVGLVILPIKDDHIMKEYLLRPKSREAIIESTPGAVFTTIKGMQELSGNLHDRVLVCLHYQRSASGHLTPCMPPANKHDAMDSCSSDESSQSPGIEDGNVEIAIIVRKGIGGTCPLRSAARTLDSSGILPLLLGTIPWTTLQSPAPALPQQRPTRETSLLPIRETMDFERQADDESRAEKGASYPYRLVLPPGRSDEIDDRCDVTPPVSVSSMGEWFDSVKATAAQILGAEGDDATESNGAMLSKDANVKDEDLDEESVDGVQPKSTDPACKPVGAEMSTPRRKRGRSALSQATPGSGVSDMGTPVTPARGNFATTKTVPSTPFTPHALRELLDDEGDDEVDELINEMKSMSQGRDRDPVSALSMSKLRLYTLSCRLEMFVQEDQWKSLEKCEKDTLFSIVRGTEAWLASRIKEWNSLRLKGFAECIGAAADLDSDAQDDEKSDIDLSEPPPSTSCQGTPIRRARRSCTQKKVYYGMEGSDDDNDGGVAEVFCKGLVDAVCSEEEGGGKSLDSQGQPIDDLDGREQGCDAVEEGSYEEEDEEDEEEEEEEEVVLNLSNPEIGDLGPGDFSSQVVKVAASAACLGSMQSVPKSDMPWPYYFISTRDCFTYHLLPIRTRVRRNGREYVRTEFYFQPGELPADYHQVVANKKKKAPAEANPETEPDESTPKRTKTSQSDEENETQADPKVESNGGGSLLRRRSSDLLASDGSLVNLLRGTVVEFSDEQDSDVEEEADILSVRGGGDGVQNGMESTADPSRELLTVATVPEEEPIAQEDPLFADSKLNQGEGMDVEGDWSITDPCPKGAFPVGVTTFTELFSPDELKMIEDMADGVHEMSLNDQLPDECFHESVGRGGNLKRTKFFFGARYLWTRDQLADPNAKRASGVRVDVPKNPRWMEEMVEGPLVTSDIIPKDFINSWALNMYHDGSEGIQSHFDDSTRFHRPIYSLRLFSDSRLSFGTQLYGYTNGAFNIPMPRGCITVMEEGSYAADGVKHCVRPMDMMGKNAGIIMRKINPEAMMAAWKFHLEESALWLKSLSLENDAVPFKQRQTRVSSEEHSVRMPDEASIANVCRRVLDRCIRKIERQELGVDGEVRSIMEVLIRGVIRGINQEEIELKRTRRRERMAVKQVLDDIVRKIEQQSRMEQRQERLRKVQHGQVRSVMESMIRRLERNDVDSRKRRSHTSHGGDRQKRCMTDSLAAARAKEQISNQSLIGVAEDIVKQAAAEQPVMLEAAQDLLQKFGLSWIKALKQKRNHRRMQQQQIGLSDPIAARSPSDHFLAHCATTDQTPMRTTAPTFQPPPVVACPSSDLLSNGPPVAWMGGVTMGMMSNSMHAPPRRDFLRAIPTVVSFSSGFDPTLPVAPTAPVSIFQNPGHCKAELTPQPAGASLPQPNLVQKEAQSAQGGMFAQAFGEMFNVSTLCEPSTVPTSQYHSPGQPSGSNEQCMKPESIMETPGPSASSPIVQNGALMNGVQHFGEQFLAVERKALVQELVNTVLKAVIPLAKQAPAACPNGMGTPTEANGAVASVAEDALTKADKLIDSINLEEVLKGTPRVARTPSKSQTPSSKTPEEGKRKYSLVPWCVCFHCEEPGVDPAQPPKGKNVPLPSDGTLLWQCRGKCRKSYHFRCKAPPADGDHGMCGDCASDNHACAICGQRTKDLVKCSMGVCGKFYHPSCVFSNPLTNVLQGTWIPVGSVEGDKTGMRFRCPQHYCRTCGLSGANIYSVACIRCPAAYHSRCLPPGCKKLSKKLVLCPEHPPKQNI